MARRGEDDSAPLFFLLAILACIVVPWSLVVLWGCLFPGRREVNEAFPEKTEEGLRVRQCQTQAMTERREAEMRRLRSRTRLLTRGFALRTGLLVLLWCWLVYIVVQVQQVLATSAKYRNFDPYEILGVDRSSGAADVKKAFRRLSLKLHPDKNPEASAAEQFMLVKKAYDSLTDPVAKRNYENFGNPDGPSTLELGVALPSFQEHQKLILVLFVLLFVIGVPLAMLWCIGSDEEVCANGLLQKTMQVLVEGVLPSIDAEEARDLLMSAGESHSCPSREGDAAALEAVQQELRGGGPPAKASKGAPPPAPRKGNVLFQVHTRRMAAALPPPLASDLQELLPKWRLVAVTMADLAAKKGMLEALRAALELHRCVVQALELGASQGGTAPLLQVPHFTADRIKLWRKGPRKAASLLTLLELPAEERRSSLEGLELTQQELADVDEFATVAPRPVIVSVEFLVEGESGICMGDVATARVKVRREDLRDGEAAGRAHAPLFPSPTVADALWVALALPGKHAGARCVRLASPARESEVELKFKVGAIGKLRCTVSVMCEAYAGLDVEQQATFEAKPAPQGHQEDDDDDEDDQ